MASTTHDELAYLSIRELSGLIHSRQLSPVEAVEASLGRIRARNESLNAFVYLNEEYALDAARAAEARLLAGDDAGPLMGVPTAIKDLNDSRPGWKGTLGGIPALKSYVIDAYCSFAERMEKAGAIALGKTNSPTMGFRGICDNYLFGPTRNPFDLTRNSGGSSGGSAAAVADGMVPFGEGTDGGGSIRIPAAWCGVFGFKGTSGRVSRLSRPSAFSLSPLFTFEGCLTRSVEDTAFVMEALCGPDDRDPYSLPDRVDWLGSLQGGVRGLRIAYSPDLGVFPVEPRVRETVERAARAFEEGGAVVEDVKLDLHRSAEELGDLWCRLMIPTSIVRVEKLKSAGIDLRRDYPADLAPEITYWMDIVEGQTIMDAVADGEARTEVYDAVQGAMAGYDLLLAPTLACLPVENGTDGNTLGPAEINGVPVNRLIGFCPTFFFNFTGHPAASVPAGLVEGKWPVGLQIIGRRFADADVMRASAWYGEARPWRETYRQVEGRALNP
jgi:amidase/aspartyl-tRNA(Asn)/glutamyl-tRNA(Gln) amidotransferase subunit A